jgi:Rrf2 family protein
MRISAEIDYACRAILELALSYPEKKLARVSAIARKQDIPLKYLQQILIQLKSADLVESVRGKQGGYRLAQEPRSITLGGLIRRLGGSILDRPVSSGRKKSVFTEIWNEAEESMVKVLDQFNFQDIAEKVKGLEGVMIYQI